MLDAWHHGSEPPEDFDPDKAEKPDYFHGFKYKYYAGYIWIWGIRYSKRVVEGQKYLLTIYVWSK